MLRDLLRVCGDLLELDEGELFRDLLRVGGELLRDLLRVGEELLELDEEELLQDLLRVGEYERLRGSFLVSVEGVDRSR